jgi:hypothetical protein
MIHLREYFNFSTALYRIKMCKLSFCPYLVSLALLWLRLVLFPTVLSPARTQRDPGGIPNPDPIQSENRGAGFYKEIHVSRGCSFFAGDVHMWCLKLHK